MHVIAKSTLRNFCAALPPKERGSATAAMNAWHEAATAANWSSYADVKLTFNTADWVGKGKVVFDVGGNKYRIVCLLGFRSKKAYVLFVGTHKQYDAIDVADI